MFMTLVGELSWQRLRRSAVDFYSKKEKIALWATLSGLRGKVRTTSMARWKARGDLIFVVIEIFSLSPTVETLWAEICRSRRFSKGWVILSADFRGKGASPTNHCWCQKTRVIVVSCGTKISAVHHLVLSKYTRLTDGRTDRRTEHRQQYRALHYVQWHGKNGNTSVNTIYARIPVSTVRLHVFIIHIRGWSTVD